MAGVKMRAFGGIAPKLNPRYLPDQRAQDALNVDTSRQGVLTPVKELGATVRTLGTGITTKTLFRFNQDYTVEDNRYWVASENDANFCFGQIIEDDNETIYFTINGGGVTPLMAFGELDPDRGDYSDSTKTLGIIGLSEFYGLGIPNPSAALNEPIPTNPEETDGLSKEFRSYVYTYVWKLNGRDMESGPSPATASVGVFLPEEGVTPVALDGVVSPQFTTDYTGGPPELPRNLLLSDVYVRFYRSVGGEFLLVNSGADIPYTTAEQGYTDTTPSEDLGEAIPSLTWNPPPKALEGLVNMPNGMMAGFVGRELHFCEPYIPHAWPLSYSVSVDSPVVGLASLDTTLVALTKERPYFIQGSSPEYLTVVKGDAEQGCLSKRSIATLNGEVYYASPDGLVATSPRGTRIVTEQMFSYAQWNEFVNPKLIHGYTHDQKYYGFFGTDSNESILPQSFIYDLPTGEFTTTNIAARAGLVDYRTDKLYLVESSSTDPVKPWGEGENLRAQWKSKVFGFPSEVSLSFVQLEAEDYHDDIADEGLDTRLTVWTDGTLFCQYRMYRDQYQIIQFPDGTLNSTTASAFVPYRNRGIMRLPSKLARDWEFQVESNYEVFNIAAAQSGEELANA